MTNKITKNRERLGYTGLLLPSPTNIAMTLKQRTMLKRTKSKRSLHLDTVMCCCEAPLVIKAMPMLKRTSSNQLDIFITPMDMPIVKHVCIVVMIKDKVTNYNLGKEYPILPIRTGFFGEFLRRWFNTWRRCRWRSTCILWRTEHWWEDEIQEATLLTNRLNSDDRAIFGRP